MQSATFLHVIGPDAHGAFTTFEFDSNDDKKKLQNLKNKFEACCTSKKNTTLERHRLLSRKQRNGEAFHDFLTDLCLTARYCQFPASQDSPLGDYIVMGVIDDKLRQRLLRQDTDDPEKVVSTCRSAEASQSHVKTLKYAANAAVTVDKPLRNPASSIKSCKYCGTSHVVRQCSAFGKRFKNCGKPNHLAIVCRSRAASV